ncbi:HAD hydrolase-like protein [Candidatus Methylacidiphilum infernorum]|uniref:phosphoglycolate phosphatase n=2 Tax=Candidatus Methylacidiphilum infernorum TaxID=511746 RepID=A0ABX7PWY8_9BACT|nr:HAD hydrolase-like protein [Candidatus Methylacidiphilum infernorum]
MRLFHNGLLKLIGVYPMELSLSMKKTKYIFLWDIDGTLIQSGGAGVKAIFRTIKELYKLELTPDEIDYRGRTDLMIAKQILSRCAVPFTSKNLSLYRNYYFRVLREEMLQSPNGNLCPGILDIVKTLDQIPTVKMGLLTGNFKKAAQIKLSHFGLWTYFSFGIFGDLHESRDYLAQTASELVKGMMGPGIEPKNIWVIGDTPHDVLCAKSAGFSSVAVSTGGFSQEQLGKVYPDHLFASFSRPSDFFSLFPFIDLPDKSR